MKLHALVVDDEPLARERLVGLLAAAPAIDTITECSGGSAAIAALGPGHTVDLCLLDVQMPEVDGFAVLEAVGVERLPPVIFVTAHDEHALRAFEVGALDYVLKPVQSARFSRALERALARTSHQARRQQQAQLLELLLHVRAAERAQATARFLVRDGDRTLVIKHDDIDWISAAGNYAELHVGPATHLVRETMSALETRLDPRRFHRVHRHSIVHVASVVEMVRSVGGWDLCLRDGTRLPIARTLHERVLTWLAGSH